MKREDPCLRKSRKVDKRLTPLYQEKMFSEENEHATRQPDDNTKVKTKISNTKILNRH